MFKAIRRLIPLVRQYQPLLFLALVLTVVNQVSLLFEPYIFKIIFDNYLHTEKLLTLPQNELIMGAGSWLLLAITRTIISTKPVKVQVLTSSWQGWSICLKSLTHTSNPLKVER
jgi:ABC-type bacteriocin/lantibiotic exporter with double-glycine peptidase domain